VAQVVVQEGVPHRPFVVHLFGYQIKSVGDPARAQGRLKSAVNTLKVHFPHLISFQDGQISAGEGDAAIFT